jgi:hypothetical protein
MTDNKEDISESSSVNIQFMTRSGTWSTVYVTQNIPVLVTNGMMQTQKIFPKARIRAVDAKTGSLIDKL